MAALQTAKITPVQQQGITLEGSVELVSEYLYCALNSILYMRGVYPSDMFEDVQKYGMCIFDAKDDELKAYLSSVMKWTSDWMMQSVVTGIVLVIIDPDTAEVLERWQFHVSCEQTIFDDGRPKKNQAKEQITEKEIRKQIGAVLKQIVASVSLLPATGLGSITSFNILVYTKDNVDVPLDWQESNPHAITNAMHLRFRQIRTSVHQVDSSVTYRALESGL